AHWLARAFSEAFLVRPVPGDPVEEASVTEIVSRLIEVLQQADQALARTDDAVLTQEASQPRRFDFVHNLALRPVLERAYADARSAFDRGDFGSSLVTACGLLESILTDALESTGQRVHHLTFDARIAAAEQAGMIKSECARLPPAAHHYRELSGAHGDLPQDVVVTARAASATLRCLWVSCASRWMSETWPSAYITAISLDTPHFSLHARTPSSVSVAIENTVSRLSASIERAAL